MDLYPSNLLTLYAADSELASLMARTPAGAVKVFPSRSGAATAQAFRADGRTVLLHSRFDPEDEARAFASSLDLEKVTVYVVLGFGLGHHVKALLAAARKESEIIVIEKDPALLRAALGAVDLREVFASRRVHLIVGKDTTGIFAALNPYVVKIFLDAVYAVHRPSAQADPEYYGSVHKAVGDYVIYGMQNVVTTVSVDFLSKLNTLMNLPWYAESPGAARYKDAFAGYPAIVVSAGPSLHRNIETLRQARGKAVIIAVSTVLRPLLHRGIKPDFAVVLDYHPISKKYFEDAPGDEDVRLVVDPKASYDAVDAHRGPKVVLHNDALASIIGEAGWHKGAIPGGTTVAHSAFYFAEHIGADPIIFVGQDLAHPDGVTHVPGTALHDIWAAEANRFSSLEGREWESILRMRNSLQKIKDVHGNDIYTDGQMFSYLRQFEMAFQNSRARVIDATEGGAVKRFAAVMTLADALSRFATRELPAMPDAAPEGVPDTADGGARGRIAAALRAHIDAMAGMRAFYDRTLGLLRGIEKAWPDQAAMRPMLEEIDSVRREVGDFAGVNRLVRDIAQAVELRKIKRDRQIVSDRLDGLDKQKAQLERDLEYVAGLRDAIDELEKVFRNALARFEAFDFDGRIGRFAAEARA